MTIEFGEKRWLFGKAKMSQKLPGENIVVRGWHKHESDHSFYVHTPNLIQDSRSRTIYLKEDVNCINEWIGNNELFVGFKAKIRWRSDSAAENEKYQDKEEALLRHPLVGREMALYLSRRYSWGKTGETAKDLEDWKWTKVKVIDGRNGNRFKWGVNPEELLKIRVTEGKYQGVEIDNVHGHDLRVVADPEKKAVLSEIFQKLQRHLRDLDDLTVSFSHREDSAHQLAQLTVELMDQGVALGIDKDLIPWIATNGVVASGDKEPLDTRNIFAQ